MVQEGDFVVFVDAYGNGHNALVTTVFTSGHPGDDGPKPAINLVYVSSDETKTDQYGRQIERETSIVHKDHQSAHGMYWTDDLE